MKKTNFLKRILFLLFFAITAINVHATTYTVTNTNDAGAGSLRQAIIDAVPGDTVDFDVFLLSSGSDTIKLNSEIAINEALVIQGFYTSYDTLFISGQNTNRIFNINLSSGTLTLRGLCLIDGYSSSSGGAITNSGSGLVAIDDCIFMNNHSDNGGGVFYKVSGSFSVTNSTFMNNTATSSGGAFNLFAINTASFTDCTFYRDSSENSGGAIYAFGTTTVNTTNCTFAENGASTSGGAIYSGGSSAVLNVINTTVSGNSAPTGGGIYFFGSSIVFTIGSSVATDNAVTNVYVFGAGASSTSLGYNVFGDASVPGSVGTDQLSVSAGSVNLGPLQDNGGHTFTMMPVSGSVAIDMGNPADPSDQQNGMISGIRDAGSAENYSCPVKYSSYFVSTCGSYTVPSGDETYSGTGYQFVNDTIPNTCGTDSIMTIIILFSDTEAPVPDVASLPDTTGECSVTPTAPTATDACAGAITGTTTTSFPITTPGTTVVTWTFDDGSGNISTQDQNVIVVPVDTTVTESGLTLTSNSTGSTYQWVDCNNSFNPIAGETNQDFTASANGSYAVIVTHGSCVDTSACYEITQVGFDENNTAISLSIYPNPSKGVFNVNTETENMIVTVYSTDGRLILEPTKIENHKQEINLGSVESGLYLLKASTEKGLVTMRLVVE